MMIFKNKKIKESWGNDLRFQMIIDFLVELLQIRKQKNLPLSRIHLHTMNL